MLEPIFKKISVLEEFKDIEFKSLDADDNEASDIVEKFQIRNVPTILVLNENNELVNKLIGAVPESKLLEFCRESLNK